MLRNLLGVKGLGKAKRNTGLLVDTETSHNVGVIKYVGADLQDKFSEGQKVYIGNQREQIRMGSDDIMVMEEANVYAIVEEPLEESEPTEA